MRTTLLALVTGAGLVFSAAALAGESATIRTAETDTVCHYVVHEGMLLKARECHSQHWWDRQRKAEQQEFQHYQMRAYSSGH